MCPRLPTNGNISLSFLYFFLVSVQSCNDAGHDNDNWATNLKIIVVSSGDGSIKMSRGRRRSQKSFFIIEKSMEKFEKVINI